MSAMPNETTLHRYISTERDAGNLGLSDEEQLAFAHLQGAVIFTHDDDFLKIAHNWLAAGRDHSGIIYVPPTALRSRRDHSPPESA
jgi:hypothetical protein